MVVRRVADDEAVRGAGAAAEAAEDALLLEPVERG